MNAHNEIAMARIVLGARIDLRCDQELQRLKRDEESRRRSQGQLFRSDRAWIKTYTMQQTPPIEKLRSAPPASFGGRLLNRARTWMTRTQRLGARASRGSK